MRLEGARATGAADAWLGLGDRLRSGLDSLRVEVEAERRAVMTDFLRLLVKWNHRFNLTSVVDPVDMVGVHLLDSLAIVPLIESLRPHTVLDVGSGAGLPGIPIAIARPHLIVKTVDAVAKKIAFQQQAKAVLRLSNLKPCHARIEDATMEAPDVIVCRAYAPLATFVSSVAHLAVPATTLVAMKASVTADELADMPSRWRVDEIRELAVPFLGARRSAVVLRLAA